MRQRVVEVPVVASARLRRRAVSFIYFVTASLFVWTLAACAGGWGEHPDVVQGPANQTVNAGQAATFHVTASGTAPLSYQWTKGGVALSGANGATYTTPVTVASDNGSVFNVTVKNAAGVEASASAMLTVNVPPTIVSPPVSQTVIAGQTATFVVSANGTAALSYQWTKNGAVIAGATNSSYTTPVTLGSDSGSLYAATVSNAAGSVASAAAMLTVNVPPTITLQPVSMRVNAGATAMFQATATGTAPMSFQWYRGGSVVGGATASSYTIPATAGTDDGSIFTVSVSNVAGTVTSAAATLNVNVGPTITIQPVSQTLTAGQSATLSVSATGSHPMTYQWYLNGGAIAGATSSVYTTPTLSGQNGGSSYTVSVTNAAGTTVSSAAVLTVNVAPTISAQPLSATVTSGQTGTFAVTAAGTGPLSYQWFKNGAPIGGATGSVYATPATQPSDNGAVFTVTVSNTIASVTSTAALLTVNAPPAIVAQPVSQTVTAPQTATFRVVASGTAVLTYQWFKNGVPIGGATFSVYTTPATSASDNSSIFTVSITNGTGSVTSVPATMTVVTTPVVNGLSCGTPTPPYGTSVSIVPSFTGQSAVIGTSGVGSSDVSAAAISGHTYASVPVTASTTFTLTVSGTGGPTAASSCTVLPTSVAVSAITPAAQTLAPGQIVFAATATGGVTDSLTWTATGGSVAGNVWTAPDTPGTYTIVATSVDNPAVHVSTTETISAPVITAQPVSKNACAGYTPSLTVGAQYATSYQWYFNGNSLGVITPALSLPAVTTSSNGSYSCAVSNGAGSVTSNVVALNVVNPTTLTITTQPASVSVYATQTATFAVSANGTGNLVYQWYTGSVGSGTPINGATSSSYTTSALSATNSGTSYYVTVKDPDCTGTTVTSTAASLTVSNTDTAVPPTIVVQPVGTSASVSGTANFTVVASGPGALSYQWYRVPYSSTQRTTPTAGSAISGATSSSYTVGSSKTAQSDDGDNYYVVVKNQYGSAVSSRAVLAVGAGIVLQITQEPQTDYVAPNTLASFSTTATCTGCIPSYQWYWSAPGSTTAIALSDGAVSTGGLSGSTIAGSRTSSLTLQNAPVSASGADFYVVVSSTSDGSTQITGTNPLTSTTAGLFVGSLGTVGNAGTGQGLCNNAATATAWVLNGTNPGTANGDVPYQNTNACTIELTNDGGTEHAAVFWPTLISTANFSVSFTVALSASSNTPADGFTMMLADPSQGATTTSLGETGYGLGADGIPGFVLGFDTFQNGDAQGDPGCTYSNSGTLTACDPVAVPYMAVGQGATNLWENPWTFVNGNLNTQSSTNYTPNQFANATHAYVVTVVNSIMTVTMDGYELFTGTVSLPPTAYLGFTASTGGYEESVTFSQMTATVSAP